MMLPDASVTFTVEHTPIGDLLSKRQSPPTACTQGGSNRMQPVFGSSPIPGGPGSGVHFIRATALEAFWNEAVPHLILGDQFCSQPSRQPRRVL